MIRSFFLAALLLCWAASLALPTRAATYPLNDGQALTGDPISATKDGLIVRISEGVFSKRVGWTNFTQDALAELVKDPKVKPFAEPFIEVDEEAVEEQKKKAIEIKIVEPERLDRPDPNAGIGSILASPISLMLLFLIYAANIYAGFEVALFRNYHPGLVCGVAAVAPIIGPVAFLCLPTHLKTQEEEAGIEDEAVPYDEAVPPDLAAQLAGEAPPPPPPEAASKYPPAKSYRRGEFTFNRRFFETQLAGFLRVVPTEAEKDMVIQVKSLRGDFIGTRLVRVLPNEIYLLVDKAGATQEVLIPFTEIQQVQVRHRDAPSRA